MKQKKPILWICLILICLLLALAAGGVFASHQLSRLRETERQADALLGERKYDEALAVYGQLLQRTPISFTGLDGAYADRGVQGVLACADALMETSEGTRYLTEAKALDSTLALISHPAIPASFREEMASRSRRCAVLLAEAEEQARREQAEREAAEAEAQRRLELLEDALQARTEGRLTEARELAKASGLQPELIDEIEAEIVREHDELTASQARTALDGLDLVKALSLAEQATDPATRTSLRKQLTEDWITKLPQLRVKYRNRIWAGAWYSLSLGDAPRLTGDKRYEGLEASLGAEDTVIGGVFSWIRISDGKVELLGDTLGAVKTALQITDAVDGALGLTHGLILHKDGTVTNLGAWQYGRDAVSEWTDVTEVAAGAFHSLGLRRDGTVAAAGLNLDGQCQVGEWTNVISVAAGLRHSVALTRDGRVLAVGDNSFGQCDVSNWADVVAIRCGGNFTLGLTGDGRLLAVGDNGCGQCNVSRWEGVIAFDGGLWHTVALLQDGRVVAAGANGHDQCAIQGTRLFETGLDDALPEAIGNGETEFVYTGDAQDGPWLYCGGEGSVIVTFDADTGKLKATRADLICTYGHPPVGILSGGGDKPESATRASKLAQQNRAVFALTGDYFTFGYNADGLQIRRGIVFKQQKDEVGFGFYPDGTMRIIDPEQVTAEELLAQGVNDSWVFGPALIEHGAALDISKHPLAYNDVTMRTVMASVCPYHHMGAAYGFSTLSQVVDDLLSCGCDIAYNLDGGRSSMLVFMGKAVNKSAFVNAGWRGLQDMVGFLTSDLVPKP